MSPAPLSQVIVGQWRSATPSDGRGSRSAWTAPTQFPSVRYELHARPSGARSECSRTPRPQPKARSFQPGFHTLGLSVILPRWRSPLRAVTTTAECAATTRMAGVLFQLSSAKGSPSVRLHPLGRPLHSARATPPDRAEPSPDPAPIVQPAQFLPTLVMSFPRQVVVQRIAQKMRIQVLPDRLLQDLLDRGRSPSTSSPTTYFTPPSRRSFSTSTNTRQLCRLFRAASSTPRLTGGRARPLRGQQHHQQFVR